MHVAHVQVGRRPALVCGTGYTGEDGVELLIDPEVARADLGRAARRRRRPLRARRPRHPAARGLLPPARQRADPERNPIEAGLGWCCAEATGFIGSEAIARARAEGTRRDAGAVPDRGRRASRATATRSSPAARQVGVVTSGTFSPSLELGAGMAYVRADLAEPGTEVEIDVRGKRRPARIASKPLYRKGAEPWPTPTTPTTCATTTSTTGRGSRATTGRLRDHLVRPGLARRGRLLRPARGRRDDPERLLLRRGRVGQGGLRRDRADLGRDRRGQRRARRTRPRRSTRTPTARAGWSRSG